MDLTGTKSSAFKFEEEFCMGEPVSLRIMLNDKQVGNFYYNMLGYNQNFSLRNSENVNLSFPRNMSKTLAIKTFRNAIKDGYTILTPFK